MAGRYTEIMTRNTTANVAASAAKEARYFLKRNSRRARERITPRTARGAMRSWRLVPYIVSSFLASGRLTAIYAVAAMNSVGSRARNQAIALRSPDAAGVNTWSQSLPTRRARAGKAGSI